MPPAGARSTRRRPSLLTIDSVEMPGPPAPLRPVVARPPGQEGTAIWERGPTAPLTPFTPANPIRTSNPDADPQPLRRSTPRSARSTTSRGRSTTPSWIRSSSSSPPGRRSIPRSASGSKAEGDRAIEHWRRQFRGEARRSRTTRASPTPTSPRTNLILWGDPDSNAVLRRIADKLPIRWEGDKIVAGPKSFPAETHAPILIYPEPAQPGQVRGAQ